MSGGSKQHNINGAEIRLNSIRRQRLEHRRRCHDGKIKYISYEEAYEVCRRMEAQNPGFFLTPYRCQYCMGGGWHVGNDKNRRKENNE